jgi:tetratricopeptide (TPR) repeat protein
VAFSPDGRQLAAGTVNGVVKVWDLGTRQQRLALRGHPQRVHSLAFSADGRLLASGAQDRGPVRLWDLKTGKELRTFGLGGLVALNPDGSRVACALQNGQVRVWSSAGGAELLSVQAPGGSPKDVGFSADGRRLVVVSVRGVAAAWDVGTGQRIAGEPAAADLPRDRRFSPDGKRLARGDGDLVVIRELQAPDARELDRRRLRTASDPGWHEQEASRRETSTLWRPARWWGAAAWHLDRLVAGRPDDPSLRQRRGEALAELGRWAEARADFAAVARAKPDDREAWRNLALAELAEGRADAYRETVSEVLRRFSRPPGALPVGLTFAAAPGDLLGRLVVPALSRKTRLLDEARAQARIVRTCLLRPGAVADPAALLPLVDGDERVARALVLCRAGRHAEVAAVLADPRARLYGGDQALGRLCVALAEHRRGRTTEARRAFDEAVRSMDAPAADLLGPPLGYPRPSNAEVLPWSTRLELRLLRRELADLLGEKDAGPVK